MPDRCLTTIKNLILTAPEHQLAHILREITRRSHNEIQRRGNRRVQIWKTYQLPANLIDERQADVKDNKVDIWEVSSSPIHIPGLGRLNRLWAQRHTLMHPNRRHAQLKRLLKYRIRHAPVIH